MKDRKKTRSRAVAAAAIGAVALLLLSTLVRCGAAAGGADEPEAAPAAQQAEQGSAQPGEGAAEEATTLSSASAFAWVAADGSGATLQITDASVIETGSDGEARAVTYAAAAESEARGQALVELALGDGSTGTLIFTVEGGEPTALSSDLLTMADEYVPRAEPAGTEGIEVAGLDERYLALVDGDEEGLREALSSHASARSPQATRATFDGEVYLDLNDGAVSATFHLDDAASTVVVARYAAGSFEVM